MMLHIGCHLSCSKGYRAMGEQALSIGADTFQFFTRNPRGGSVKPFDRQDADALNAFLAEHRFAPILAHAPYTQNACAADASIREFAVRTMREDLQRLAYIPTAMLNFHPGSHVKQGVEVGVRYIADLLDAVMTDEVTTPILLETWRARAARSGAALKSFVRLSIPRATATNSAFVWIPAMCTTQAMTWSGGLMTCSANLTACLALRA